MSAVRYRQTVPEGRKLWSVIGWIVVGLPVVALMLRFGMRLLGVRTDVALPGFVYWVTTRVVTPFYRFFPADARFDHGVIEVAALAAAGAVFLVGVGLYLLGLLIMRVRGRV